MGSEHRITLRVSGFTGVDMLMSILLPPKLLASWVARDMVRGHYKGWNFASKTELVAQLPSGCWRVLDAGRWWRWPRVERAAAIHLGGM